MRRLLMGSGEAFLPAHPMADKKTDTAALSAQTLASSPSSLFSEGARG